MLNLIKHSQFKFLFSSPIVLGDEQDKGTTSIEKPAAAGSSKSLGSYKINGFIMV